MNEEIRAAAYCRFSSEMQRDSYSIEAQRLAISKYCEAKGYRLVAFYVDEARSASKDVMKREQFQRMVGDSSLHAFDVLVVHKLDRFARNRADAAVYRRLLRENGVRIESVLENIQEGPEGIIMEGILDSYAEYYSANLSRETKKGQSVAAAKGMVLGQCPLGYEKGPDGRYAIDAERAPLAIEIFERASQGEALVDISRALTARGAVGKRGEPLSYNALRKIVQNPLYRGDHLYAGKLYEGVAPALVSHEAFALANESIQKKKPTRAQPKVKKPYALSGLLFCGECGSPFVGWSASDHKGGAIRYYRCSGSSHGHDPFKNAERCTMKVIRAEELELCVMEAIERLVHDDMDFVWDGLAEQMNERIREMAKGSDLPRLKDSRANLEKRKTRLLDAYLAGAVELEVFRSRSLGIDAELSRIALEISKQSGEIPDEVDGETVRAAFLYYFEKEKTHADDRAHFFRVFIDRIVISSGRIEFFFRNKKGPVSSSCTSITQGALSSSPCMKPAMPFGFALAFAIAMPPRGGPRLGDVQKYSIAL